MLILHDETASDRDLHRSELRRRMARPQRHRLLQGYPMAPLMTRAPPRFKPWTRVESDPTRPTIVGVLPHTFCNPKVRGCGFCTFPHEKLSRSGLRRTTERVVREIERAPTALTGRDVTGIYFGGGTANLTPTSDLRAMCDALAARFAIAQAELTLEGVPKYFLLEDEALLDVIAAAPVRHRRISMGVQTFDATFLARMGRDAFGNRDEIAQVVEAAHRRGFTASCDLLFNLPGAPIERALADVQAAVAIGFDQICAYNLVLNGELDTEWARDRELVQLMPHGSRACATWLMVREALIEHGYVQTTLTNFERADVASSPRRFVYEPASFDPARHDAVGFGPGAISTLTDRRRGRATKWMNAGTSEAYIAAIDEGGSIETYFAYAREDLRLLHLTRGFATMKIDCAEHESIFGSDPIAAYPRHFEVLEHARLVAIERGHITLTPEGMFYADAVTGLLAWQRTADLRAAHDDIAMHGHMG